jgi:hypothetical protein
MRIGYYLLPDVPGDAVIVSETISEEFRDCELAFILTNEDRNKSRYAIDYYRETDELEVERVEGLPHLYINDEVINAVLPLNNANEARTAVDMIKRKMDELRELQEQWA